MSTIGFAPSTFSTSSLTRPSLTRPAVRLTRRGKVAVFLTALLVVLLLAVAFGPRTIATAQAGDPVPTTTVEVMPGQTLWSIAADANPGGDVRATVDDIMELNSLPSASGLQMGTELAVPVYDR